MTCRDENTRKMQNNVKLNNGQNDKRLYNTFDLLTALSCLLTPVVVS